MERGSRDHTPVRASRTDLSRERIAATALELLDREGLEALSMRRLAEELCVGTMTLYRYFRDKEELLDAVVDATVPVDLPDLPEGTWRERIAELLRYVRLGMTRHPGLVSLRLDRPFLSPGGARFTELTLQILRDGGFTREEAVSAYRALFSYTLGFVYFFRFAGEEGSAARRAAQQEVRRGLEALPEEEFPAMTESAAEFGATVAAESQFDYGLERLLDGLEAARS